MKSQTVYLVISDCDDGYIAERVYLDRDEADAFVAAKRVTGAYLEVEERELGAPDVAYDGPFWRVTWTTRRKLKGERQLILVTADGFTTVIPSAVPGLGGYFYREYFAGPSWADLVSPVEYEEPPVWIDQFSSRQDWTSGDHPGEAKLTARNRHEVTAHGISKDACEELVRANAIEVKAELGVS